MKVHRMEDEEWEPLQAPHATSDSVGAVSHFGGDPDQMFPVPVVTVQISGKGAYAPLLMKAYRHETAHVY